MTDPRTLTNAELAAILEKRAMTRIALEGWEDDAKLYIVIARRLKELNESVST